MSNLLEMLKTRREEKAGDVIDIARRCASGEAPDPDRILAACQAADMSDESFLALVDLIAKRAILRRSAADHAPAEREAKDLEQGIAKAYEMQRAAEEKFADQVRPLEAKLKSLRSRVESAGSAVDMLGRDDMLPPHLREARESASRRVNAACDAVRPVSDRLESLERELGYAREKLNPTGKTSSTMREIDAQEFMKSADYRIGKAREELAALEAKRDAAKAEHARIDKECRAF